MNFRRTIALIALLAALAPARLAAQRVSPWREFRAADRLTESFSTAITIGQRGNVLVRHREGGLSLLDGYTVRSLKPPAGNFRVHESRSGQLWSIHDEGVQWFADNEWRSRAIPGVSRELAAPQRRSGKQIPLVPAEQDRVFILLPNRLIEFDVQADRTTVLREADSTSLEVFIDMIPDAAGGLIVTGRGGIARIAGPLRSIRAGSLWDETLPDRSLGLSNLSRPIEDQSGRLMMLGDRLDPADSEESVTAVLLSGAAWKLVPIPGRSLAKQIRAAWMDADDQVIFQSFSGLVTAPLSALTNAVPIEVPSSGIFDSAVQGRGVFWLATDDGVHRHAPPLWQVPASLRAAPSPAYAAVRMTNGSLLFVERTALRERRGNRWETVALTSVERSFQSTDAAWQSPDGRVFFDGSDGISVFTPGSAEVALLTHPDDFRYRLLGRFDDSHALVHVLDPSDSASGAYRLEIFDGSTFTRFPGASPPGTLGPALKAAHVSKRGDLWLGGTKGVAVYHGGSWESFDRPNMRRPEGGYCFAETVEGRIWCGGRDNLWEFSGKEWQPFRSGFEQIHSILAARDGTMWVGSEGGVHRYSVGTWMQHGIEEGLPGSAVLELIEDSEGRIWSGTSRGIAVHDPMADLEPPASAIATISRGKSFLVGEKVDIQFSGTDRWNYTRPERLLFSHRMDEGPWTEPRPLALAPFPDLPSGSHRFEVRAIDRNGNVDARPAALEFDVFLPWYREPRVVTIAGIASLAAVFFAWLAWNRHRQLLRSHAEIERLVNLRTEQLAQANTQLLHSQKMNALGTLAAGVAHDFNNILSIVKGSAQIIERNLGDPEKIRTRIERIRTVVDQGAAVVQSLLGFSRAPEKTLARCNANEVVEETIRLLGDRFLNEIEIDFDWAPGLPETFCAKTLVQQVLLNIILNAADAMNGGGRIAIRTGEVVQLPEELVLKPGAAREFVFISIRDHGSGIAPEVLPRIFEPFFTTKNLSQRRGTGLGLSMVYRIAAENSIGLHVESQLNVGTTFVLYLPVLSTAQASEVLNRGPSRQS